MEGGGWAKKYKKPQSSCRHIIKNGGDSGRREKPRRREGVSSVDVDPGYLKNIKDAEREP